MFIFKILEFIFWTILFLSGVAFLYGLLTELFPQFFEFLGIKNKN